MVSRQVRSEKRVPQGPHATRQDLPHHHDYSLVPRVHADLCRCPAQVCLPGEGQSPKAGPSQVRKRGVWEQSPGDSGKKLQINTQALPRRRFVQWPKSAVSPTAQVLAACI